MDRPAETAFIDQNTIALALGMRDLEIMALREQVAALMRPAASTQPAQSVQSEAKE